MDLVAILGILAMIVGTLLLSSALVSWIVARIDKKKPTMAGKLLLYGALTLLCSFTLCTISLSSNIH